MLSIRGKLTLWYLAILAIVLIGYGVANYLYVSGILLSGIDASLRENVIMLRSRLQAAARNEEMPEEPSELLAIQPHFIELIGPDGEITDRGVRSGKYQLPIDPQILDRARQHSQPVLENATTSEGKLMRVATCRVFDEEDGSTYFIRAGYLIEGIRQAQWRVLLLLFLSIPVILLLASFGGRLLANKALKPIDELTRAAQTISAKNLKERVQAPATKDELARLAETFNEMISRLDKAFDRERQFTQDASHELRTPLAIMRNEIEVALRRERPAEEYKLILQRCLEELLRLSRLVDDLLTLARSDTGRLTLEQQVIKLGALCQEMVDYVRPLAEDRGLKLSLSLEDAPVTIKGDMRRLKQLILNLLDNAIKYTLAGGQIRVTVRGRDSMARVKVADTGRGIPREDLPHIFDRFYRRQQKLEGQTTGFGLGLAICKWIVEAHGGTIRAESEIDKGTQIRFDIPLRRKTG